MARVLRIFGSVLLWAVVVLCCVFIVAPRFLDRLYYEGPNSGHLSDNRFFNPDGDDTFAPPAGGSRSNFFIRYFTQSDNRPAWPEHVAISPVKPAARVDGQRMVVTWVGHASVLVQTQGLNILTDPGWSDVAGPFGIGPKRVVEPGVRFDDLPKIDVVLISHDHYDHMDLPTL